MRVLIACEFSGSLRDRVSARLGLSHTVMSCDLLPAETQGLHHQGDVADLLDGSWDCIIAFPPCTYLSRAGAQYWAARKSEQMAAATFVKVLAQAAPLTAIENPPGALTRLWRPADQYVCPSWWGADYTKKTGLWLRGLSPLAPPDRDRRHPNPAHFTTRFPHSGAGHNPIGPAWKRRVRLPGGLAEAITAQWFAERSKEA